MRHGTCRRSSPFFRNPATLLAGRSAERRKDRSELRGPIPRNDGWILGIDRRGLYALAIFSWGDTTPSGRAAFSRRGNARRGRSTPDVAYHDGRLGMSTHFARSRPESPPRFDANRNGQQALASCPTTLSGSATCRTCALIALFPLRSPARRPRTLPAIRGFSFNTSLRGGLELFEPGPVPWSDEERRLQPESPPAPRSVRFSGSDPLLDSRKTHHPDSDSQTQVS